MNDKLTCESCRTREATIGMMCEDCVKALSEIYIGWATNQLFRRDQNEPVYPLVRLH
jgi:hypothetical protein